MVWGAGRESSRLLPPPSPPGAWHVWLPPGFHVHRRPEPQYVPTCDPERNECRQEERAVSREVVYGGTRDGALVGASRYYLHDRLIR